jgi:putative heme-binding domain-containing protein
MTRLFLTLAAAGALWSQQPLNHPENPFGGDPEAIARGQKVYMGSCSGCHGATGEGGRGPNLRDGRLIRRSTDFQVMNTIKKGVPGSDMPPTNLPDERVWELVAFVRAMGAPASEAAVAGNPAHGEEVYRSAGCANCHAINGRGGALGPDLTNIGATRSYGVLKESVEKPGERLATGYQPVTVTTKDGRTLSGMVKNYTNYDLQMTDKSGQLHLFQTADLSNVQLSMTSPMPSDYSKRLSRDDLTDLLAYLSRRSLRPPAVRQPRQRGQR